MTSVAKTKPGSVAPSGDVAKQVEPMDLMPIRGKTT